MSTNRVAVVVCVHHRPWLVMSTLISLLAQDYRQYDLYLVFNVGDGQCLDRPSYEGYRRIAGAHRHAPPDPRIERESYRLYDRLARKAGINAKLSPFDERVRLACRIRRPHVYEMEFENDHALDSGAWLKFIRTGIWRQYDYTVCVQEGTLLTRASVASAALRAAENCGVQFLAGAHYKECLPKRLFLSYNTRGSSSRPIDVFHDRMIRATFDVFCRDQQFRRLFDAWSNEVGIIQENHVPDLWARGRGSLRERVLAVASPESPLPRHWAKRGVAVQLRRHPGLTRRLDAWMSWSRILYRDLFPARLHPDGAAGSDMIHVNAVRRPVRDVVETIAVDHVRFHREAGPEWHGCGCNHMFSRAFLEELAERLERYGMYDVLDLPFAGTALEVIWGFLPNWLGVEKWFFDGFHRVTKDFVSYRREDDPQTIARYINRYFPDQLYVEADGEYLKIRHMARALSPMREMLNERYF